MRIAFATGLAALLLVAPAADAAAIKRQPVSTKRYGAGIVVRHERVTIDGRTSNVTTITMPEPGRGRVLEPILPGDVVSKGTMTTSSASRQLGRYGTAVAINADLFEYASGQSSGMLMIDGEIYNQPQGGRPALSIDYDGKLTMSTPRARGSLQLPGGRSVPFEVNVKRPNGVVTYDSGWGKSAPGGGSAGAILRVGEGTSLKHKPTTIEARAPQMRVMRAGHGTLRIPSASSPDMLFQGYGSAARQLKRLRHGQKVSMRYSVGPLSAKTRYAIGGGPVLIRDGKIVYRRDANTEFSDGQLVPPDARTAVAQTKGGKVIYYVVDQGAGSAGFTVPDVAKDLKSRGAERAMAFDSGGSTAVSIDGQVLNKPSDGYERPVGTILMYFAGKKGYRKPIGPVRVAKPAAGSVAPQLSYTLKGRAKVEIRLLDPSGATWGVKDGVARAGTHPIATPAHPSAGRWHVEIVAPDSGDRVVKTFKVTKKPAPAADAGTAPSAGAPLVEQPVRETSQAPAPATATSPAADDSSGPWAWVAIGVGLLAIAGAALLLVRRRRR
jgi:hypothetical protein